MGAVLTVGLEGLTLLAALLVSRTGRRLFRVASVVVVVAFLTSIVSVAVSASTDPTGWFFALNVLLVAAAPVAIARSLIGRHRVDVHTVMGAICIYVLIGMAFAFVYAAMSSLGDRGALRPDLASERFRSSSTSATSRRRPPATATTRPRRISATPSRSSKP